MVAIPIVPAAPVSGMMPAPTVPRAYADKDSADKPLRTVIAIGSACVRIVRVVAPAANWWTVGVSVIVSVGIYRIGICRIGICHDRGTDAYTDGDLRFRRFGERQG
jgi:hypothetical protein